MNEQLARATKNLTEDELTVFYSRFKREKKKNGLAYLWWILFSAVGGHRFYLGQYKSGLVICAITFFTCGLGAIVGLLDVLNIPRLIGVANEDVLLKLIKDVKRK